MKVHLYIKSSNQDPKDFKDGYALFFHNTGTVLFKKLEYISSITGVIKISPFIALYISVNEFFIAFNNLLKRSYSW